MACVVMLKLRIEIADEIPGVGFVDELRNAREGFDAFFRVAEILVDEAEVVPGEGILGQFFSSGGEGGPCGLELLLGKKRDAEIEARDVELRVGGERFFEKFFGVGGALLIHVSHAECVEAISFGRVEVRRGFLRGCGWRRRLRRVRVKKNRREKEGR